METDRYTVYHKDGSVWATGELRDGAATGDWVWFRKDGTKMRSGSFRNGHQVGTWTTYNSEGNPHKVTVMKEKDTGEKIPFKPHS